MKKSWTIDLDEIPKDKYWPKTFGRKSNLSALLPGTRVYNSAITNFAEVDNDDLIGFLLLKTSPLTIIPQDLGFRTQGLSHKARSCKTLTEIQKFQELLHCNFSNIYFLKISGHIGDAVTAKDLLLKPLLFEYCSVGKGVLRSRTRGSAPLFWYQ